MDTYLSHVMDEFFYLANNVLSLDHDAQLIDRLTTVGGYSQLLEIDPGNDEYFRKFQHIAYRLLVITILLISSARLTHAQDVNLLTHPPIRVQGSAHPAIAGYIPSQIRHAYGFDQVREQGGGQTIAIVDAYDHPRIEHDLGIFNQTFGLPECTTSNGCFQKIYVGGTHPGTDTLWALEEALDVEWAHAMAPQARILLVESPSSKLVDMIRAVDVAVQSGATVVSLSWGTYEFPNEVLYDNHFVAAHVSFVAASGDFGNPGLYPAASPFVTSVGGTTLQIDPQGSYLSETAWSASGGGLSAVEVEPIYQTPFNVHGKRGAPDVAYNADPNTGFAVYDSVPHQGYLGWIEVGGTSAGAPQWAALVAIADALRLFSNKYPLTGSNDALYGAAATAKSYKANYHDIISGANGTCGTICAAATGYDFVTGLGSPQVPSLINAIVKAP